MEPRVLIPRTAGIALLVGSASLWAACCVIGGLWLIFDLSRAIPAARWVVVIAGIGAIAAGEFVFLVGAADILFPRVGRRIGAWAGEMALFGAFFLCFVLVVLVVVWSASP